MSQYRAYFVPGAMDPWGFQVGVTFPPGFEGFDTRGPVMPHIETTLDPEVGRPFRDLCDQKGGCKAKGLRFICRTMPSARQNRKLRHCYLVSTDGTGNALEVFSGQQDKNHTPWDNYWLKYPLAVISQSEWDQDYYDKGYTEKSKHLGMATQTEYPIVVPNGKSLCEINSCMYRHAAKINGTETYWQAFRNSNTFLRKLMEPCGLWAKFPDTAIAAGTVGDSDSSCTFRCLGGRRLSSSPQGKANFEQEQACLQKCKNARTNTGWVYTPKQK